MDLKNFYYQMDLESKEISDKIEAYIAIAKSIGLIALDYEQDIVYKKLMEEKNKYQFLKNKIMNNMR